MSEENKELQENSEVVKEENKKAEETQEKSPFPEEKDYSQLSTNELVVEFKSLLDQFEVQFLKQAAEQVRKSFYDQVKVLKQAKLDEFIAQGGNEIDFSYEHPDKKAFQQLWDEFQARKKRRREMIEERMKEGLQTRLALIEEMKSLIEGEEKMNETFQHFREIQEKWRNAGPVPKSESSEVFRNYHFQVERFYDYVRLNDELRDLDFKKNLEHKQGLIAKAKELLEHKDVHKAFKQLQNLHKKWKEEGGPVVKEMREKVWEEFSDITNQIHEKRREVIQKEKDLEQDVLKKKEALLEEFKALVQQNPSTHQAWQKAVKSMEGIFENFKKAGHLSKSLNDKIWQEYKELRQEFNHKKNEFYKEHKQELADNLEKLKVLTEEAENSINNEDRAETANYLKSLQADWKKVRPVPRKAADKYWKRFRAACNAFFGKLEKEQEEAEKAFVENLEKKKAFLKEKAELELEDSKDKALAQIKELQDEWKGLGQVPRSAFKEISNEYRKLMDRLYSKLDIDQEEQQKIRITSAVEDKLANQGDRKVEDDIQQIKRSLDSEKKELANLERNLSFFTNTSSGKNPLMAEAEKKFTQQKRKVEKLENELHLHRKLLNIYRKEKG